MKIVGLQGGQFEKGKTTIATSDPALDQIRMEGLNSTEGLLGANGQLFVLLQKLFHLSVFLLEDGAREPLRPNSIRIWTLRNPPKEGDEARKAIERASSRGFEAFSTVASQP
jgi:hypothetical protein